TANVPGGSAAYRGTAAAATTSASLRRSIVMRSRANGRSVSECQRKRPDQFRKGYSQRLECRESAPPRVQASLQPRKLLPSQSVGAPATPKVRDKIAGWAAGRIRPKTNDKINNKTSDKIRPKISDKIRNKIAGKTAYMIAATVGAPAPSTNGGA